MNDFFNWRRFRALAVKEYVENGRNYLGLIAGMLVYFSLLYWISFGWETKVLTPSKLAMLVSLFGFGFCIVLFTSIKLHLKTYFDKPTRITSLTLPASVFEKYLLAWFNSLVLSACVYLLLFWGTIHVWGGHLTPEVWTKILSGVASWVLLHSLIFYLYAACRKYAVVGIVAAFVGLWFLCILYSFVTGAFVGGSEETAIFPWSLRYTLTEGRSVVYFYQESKVLIFFLGHLALWLTWGVLTLGGYYRFKENQAK